jgi:Transglutaminase-like superfamily
MYTRIYSFIALFFIDKKIKTHGFKHACESIRTLKQKTGKSRLADSGDLYQICRAVNEVCDRHLFIKKAECLHQSILAADILVRKGIPVDLRIGVSKTDFSAHAWVEYKGRVINDKPDVHETYNVILSI